MDILTEEGKSLNVEEANLQFAAAMSASPKDDEPTAPAPPRLTEEQKAPRKPPARKPAAKKKPAPAPTSPTVHKKRAEAGADLLHTAAVFTATLHATTGDEAWEKDTEVLASAAPAFGEALANVADHNPAFARYLDADSGGGAAMSYLGLAAVGSQISMALIDNHNARGKLQLLIKGLALKVKGFTQKVKKSNARGPRKQG